MRDASGGAVSIFIIVVFIIFALGYMAFNVNYTKAFRMKDKIINVYEKYKGNCNANCQQEISAYSQKIGYRPDGLKCAASTVDNLYCVRAVEVGYTPGAVKDRKTRCYYHITTRVNVKIPIIEYLMNISVFDVSGDTKTIEVDGNSC